MTKVGEAVELAARELVGQRLSQVRYYTVLYGMTDKPAWDFDVAHVAAFGIDIVTSDLDPQVNA